MPGWKASCRLRPHVATPPGFPVLLRRMRERAAQAVLLARFFEESDPEGVMVSGEDRQQATAAGRERGGSLPRQAERRARALLAVLDRRLARLPRVRSWTRISPALIFPLICVAFLAGLSTNALGPSRQINLLAFPLLALIVWNLGAYVFLILGPFLRMASRRELGRVDRPGGGLARSTPENSSFMASVASWAGEWALERVRAPDPRAANVVSQALSGFWVEWARCSLPVSVLRLRSFLHFGAAFLASGVVAGMYVRGLGLEYRAMWESTFLSASAVAGLLELFLGPASWILGIELPDAARLESMTSTSGATAAAPWIHLWALTTAGIVVGPRLVLGSVQLSRAAILARALPVEPVAGSFRALLRPDRGADVRVQVWPYSQTLGPEQQHGLYELLGELFGLQASVETCPAVNYGDDVSPGQPSTSCVVIVYSLVQSPEREVHGRYVQDWTELGAGFKVLVVLDTSSWRKRFGEGESRRESERRSGWDRVLREVGVTPLVVDLEEPVASELVDRAEAALWPTPSTGATNGGR